MDFLTKITHIILITVKGSAFHKRKLVDTKHACTRYNVLYDVSVVTEENIFQHSEKRIKSLNQIKLILKIYEKPQKMKVKM